MVMSADRPLSGTLYHIKTFVNTKYKLIVRNAYNTFERARDNALLAHWLSKNPQEFRRRGILNSQIKLPHKCILLTVHLILISSVNFSIILIMFMIKLIMVK
jgi:hypothetical protein